DRGSTVRVRPCGPRPGRGFTVAEGIRRGDRDVYARPASVWILRDFRTDTRVPPQLFVCAERDCYWPWRVAIRPETGGGNHCAAEGQPARRMLRCGGPRRVACRYGLVGWTAAAHDGNLGGHVPGARHDVQHTDGVQLRRPIQPANSRR